MKNILIFFLSFFISQSALSQDSITNKNYVTNSRNSEARNILPRFPADFDSTIMVNEYYFAQNKNSSFFSNHYFTLKISDDCRFLYEVLYLPYDSAVIEKSIGVYQVTGDTIFLKYDALKLSPDSTHQVGDQQFKSVSGPTSLPVSWILPDKPNYVLIQKKSSITVNFSDHDKGVPLKLKGQKSFEIVGCKYEY